MPSRKSIAHTSLPIQDYFYRIYRHLFSAGLDKALERVEERTYDAVVEIVNSQEVDKAVRDSVNSVFSRMRGELGGNKWWKHLGIRY